MTTAKILLTALLLTCTLGLLPHESAAQSGSADYHGAAATLKHYNALYAINEAGDKKIRSVLNNIKNALEDPRLAGKLTAELVTFGDGVAVYQKSNPYESLLKDLLKKGVILAQCSNTLRERHIDKNELFPFIGYVPSGNGEIIIRQHQGWAVVHP